MKKSGKGKLSLNINIYLLIFSYFFNILWVNNAQAHSDIRPVQFSIIKSRYDQNSAQFALQLKVDHGWKVYSNEIGETGLPFKIVFETPKNIKSYQIYWPTSQLFEQDGVRANVFTGNITIPIEIIPTDNHTAISTGLYIEYGVCKDYCLRLDQQLFIKMLPNYFNEAGTKIIKESLPSTSLLNNPSKLNFFLVILFALIGGFILNLMPCVLPVLSLKLLNIIKNCKEDSTTARANLIFSTAGVITSFILLAIVTQVLKILGTSVGWGFHFQEPGFIIFLIIVLILFASNLWGDFEINLPTWINKIHNLSNTKLSYANSFVSGAFATLLATPCTAPFLTVAVAFGLSQDFIYLLIIYFFIGVGMSLPFIVLAIKTNLLKLFPKPGRWMIKLKKFFAILLLLTALWLIYVLSFQLSIQAILIFFGSLVIIKAIITNKLIFKTFNSKFVLVLVAITVAYSITFKTETKQQYHQFEIENMWERFSESKLYQYINEGHIVFVDITAEWCLTCKINKFKALEQKDITQLFRDKNIKLLRGDYTNKSPELNTFLLRYNHYGIPFNAIYSKKYPNGILLPELLSKSDIQDNINKAK